MTLKAGELVLVYLLIWALALSLAFGMSAYGLNLLGDAESVRIAGEMSNFGIFTVCIGTSLGGALLMLRKAG